MGQSPLDINLPLPMHAHDTLPAFLLVLALLGGPSIVAAQPATGHITGQVVEQSSGAPLAQANVRVLDTPLGTSTENDGHFELNEVPVGPQTLEVTYVGYETVRRQVEVETGTVVELTVALPIDPSELEEVEVVGHQNAFQQNYETTTTQTEVEPQTLEDFNSANNYDALRLIPGVHYLNGAGGRYGSPSRIRGSSSWVIPEVIEGFPSIRESGIGAEDGGLKAGLGASIPSVALEAVEVKKGNSGVLYSGGANGGVIVNQLERGRPGPPSGELFFEVNPVSERLYMGDLGGGTERFDYYVAAKVLNGNYEGLTDNVNRSVTSDDFMSGLARLGYNFTSSLRLEATGLRGEDEIRYHQPREDDPETEPDESLDPQDFETTNATTFAGVRLEHELGDALSYEAGYSYHQDWVHRFSITQGRSHRDRPQYSHTGFANIYLDHTLARGVAYHGKLGGEVLRHHQQENAGDGELAHDFTDRSVFLANSVEVQDRLFLNGGLRFLHATDDFQTQNLVLYDLGAAYRIPVTETKVHASYSTGYSRNKGFTFFFGPIEEAGGVKLSESWSAEIGVEQPFSLTGTDEGRVRITGYRRLDERAPVFSGWGAGEVYYEDHESLGLEVLVRERLGRLLSVMGSFGYTDTEVLDTTHPDGIGVGNTSVPVPQYTAGLGLQVRPISKLRLHVLGTYDDGMRTRKVNTETGEATVVTNSSFTRINVSGSYDVTSRLTVQLRIENVLNQTDLGYSSETFGPEGYSQTESAAERPGRFVSLAVQFAY